MVRDYVGYVKARYTEILEETDKVHDLQVGEIQNKQNAEQEHTIKLYNETRGEKVILQRRNKELSEQMMRYQDELSEAKMLMQEERQMFEELKAEVAETKRRSNRTEERAAGW